MFFIEVLSELAWSLHSSVNQRVISEIALINLCRPEYFTCESTKFFDPSHMNSTGAEEYSKLVGRFLSGEIAKEELFYDSYEEKLGDMGNRVFGLAYTIETDESGKTVHLEPVASAEFPVYVNIESVSAGGTETRIIEKELLEDLHFDNRNDNR